MSLEAAINEAVSRGLVDLQLRESIGGWQAIAKYRGREGGPWGVGCHADPVTALNTALEPEHKSEMGVFD